MEQALINKKYKLEKFAGKGGWTYALIPEILPDRKAPFGWVNVKGLIDHYEIENCRLLPMGNGKLFLPVKAEIQRKIKKVAGDEVHIVLYSDDGVVKIPEQLKECLMDEPCAYRKFMEFRIGERKAMIDWIYEAKKEETRAERIAKAINNILAQGNK
jgi:hypothetical protein